MNDEVINDLKQFISTTVSQQTSDIDERFQELDTKIDERIKRLDTKLSAKIDDLSSSVAEALDNSNEVTDTQLKDHERRIVNLEQKTV